MSTFEEELIQLGIKHKVFSEPMVRNWKIYKRYCQLNYIEKIRSSDAFEIIAQEFPPITASGIQKIVYREKKRHESIRSESS
ncbi:MAG: hypothetical protein KGZ42_07375 [Melioribacter sp.]|nr:hypothetical protein [Melioribacter sp.]